MVAGEQALVSMINKIMICALAFGLVDAIFLLICLLLEDEEPLEGVWSLIALM